MAPVLDNGVVASRGASNSSRWLDLAMRKISTLYFALLFLALLVLPFSAFAQDSEKGEGPLIKEDPKGITVDEVIQRFATKEKDFKIAREKYTYRETVLVQTLDGDTVDGEYQIVFDVLFDNKGRRMENVVFAPQSTLQRIMLSPEDEQDFRTKLPFVLTSDEVPEYSILYVGQQREDELNTFVFDIAPKQIEKGKRYFQGRIWVDDHDFQIVKTHGKTVPDIRNKKNENLFPAFTTYREQIDGKYWFPTYTYSLDTLHFSNQDVKVKEIIKYTNYKRFGSDVKITYEGQDIKKTDNQQPGQQPQQAPQAPPKQ
jgi:hypothetical protein